MTAVDIVLLLMVIAGAFSGYRQGFLMTLFSLAALFLGVIGAFKLLGYAIVLLSSNFNIDKTILPYVAFAVVFIGILIAVNLLGRILKASIDQTFLGWVDKAAGSALGVLRSVFLLSVALWIVASLDITLPSSWTEDSWLLPRIEAFAPQVAVWLAEYIPFFNDVFT